MWTPTTRRQHSRDHLRYGSDLSDAEWEIIAPFMPPPGRTGRPREWPMREIMNAIFHVLRSGCAWRMLPKDFPPMTTVYGWFLRFRREGLFETINHHLVMLDRERVGRQASPLDRYQGRQKARRSSRLHGLTQTMGGRALLRLDQPKPPTGQGLRGHNRLSRDIPLCRLCHAPHSTIGALRMSFKTDSKSLFKNSGSVPIASP